MRSAAFRIIAVLVFVAGTVGVSPAQTSNYTPDGERLAAAAGGAAVRSIPFAVGETLTYEGKVSKNILRGIAVADLTFTVEEVPGSTGYLVKAEAKSKGTLLKLFRYSFLQQLQSTMTGADLRALKTVKHDVQKDRVRDSIADFDYGERRVTYVETNPDEPMRPARKIASEISGPTHDLITSLYNIRSMPLEVGKSFRISVSDSGLVYDIPVKVTARERQKTVLGNVSCFRVEPDVFGPGRLIEKEGSMIIWITADARRIPVRSQVNADIGRIEIKLRSVKNLK